MSFITTIFYVPFIIIMGIGSLIWEALPYALLPLLIWYFYRQNNKK